MYTVGYNQKQKEITLKKCSLLLTGYLGYSLHSVSCGTFAKKEREKKANLDGKWMLCKCKGINNSYELLSHDRKSLW